MTDGKHLSARKLCMAAVNQRGKHGRTRRHTEDLGLTKYTQDLSCFRCVILLFYSAMISLKSSPEPFTVRNVVHECFFEVFKVPFLMLVCLTPSQIHFVFNYAVFEYVIFVRMGIATFIGANGVSNALIIWDSAIVLF